MALFAGNVDDLPKNGGVPQQALPNRWIGDNGSRRSSLT
jgi:hypothetical protein